MSRKRMRTLEYKAKQKAYRQTPEYKAKRKAWCQGLKYKAYKQAPEYIANRKAMLQRLKDKIYDHYGKVCSCPGCDESRQEFLTIDHIDGNGRQHKKEIGGGSYVLYRWISNNNFPDNFRVLCMNCNFSLGKYGYCPHEKEQLY